VSNRRQPAPDYSHNNGVQALARCAAQPKIRKDAVMTQDNNQPVLSTCRQAFDEVKNQIAAVPEEQFMTVSLDIAASVITIQGAYPEILALRPQFVKELPLFDISKLDKLETYALALFCAQADFKAANEPPPTLVALATEVLETRTVLFADVQSLIARRLLPASVTDGLQGASGYKNLMMDLATLAGILRKNAAKIAGRTSVQPDELSAAEDLANRFGRAVGLREQSPQVLAEASRQRQAAYTLCISTYNEVRAGVQYIRRNAGDADSIAPSLFANRGTRYKPVDDTEPAASPAPAAVQPSAPVGSTPGNGATAAAALKVQEEGPYVA
jgi:hypothetical protein